MLPNHFLEENDKVLHNTDCLIVRQHDASHLLLHLKTTSTQIDKTRTSQNPTDTTNVKLCHWCEILERKPCSGPL
jgi:hypothetical protein